MKFYTFFVGMLLFAAVKTTSAHAAVSSFMVDAKSGNVLYAENADVLRYPASLTKLMTLYIVFNALESGRLKLDDELKISHTAANRSPSRLGLTPGKTIDVRNAILGTIVKSANDCATVLGESLAASERDFAVLMTETAKKLGMNNTTFKNASGLQHSQQKTTARDMAILAMALYHHFPQYYSWFSIQEFEYEGKKYTSHNFLLKDFDGADGMKTGYTAAAGFNIITSARRENRRVIAVTMGHETQKQRDKKVFAMMDQSLDVMNKLGKVDSNQLKQNISLALNEKTSLDSYLPKTSSKTFGQWAIQIGAFGNHGTAQKQAQNVKNKLSGKFVMKDINVEKFTKNGSSVYRSQIVGFAKSDADKACQLLKKQGSLCLVMKHQTNKTYAQR